MTCYNIYFPILLLIVLFSSCQINEQSVEKKQLVDPLLVDLNDDISISFTKGKAFNHPSFVVWIESIDGKLVKTLLITQSYASGIFNYKMQGDTVWENTPGESIQPAALPYWTIKKGKIGNDNYVPTKENPYIDAYTAATPKSDFIFNTQKPKFIEYRVLVEVNQPWDWNSYWTNDKYPGNQAYNHSAQPSVVYAVTVNSEDSVFYLNPIGHGDPKGEIEKLFTNLSTLTSAKEIFSEIAINIK